jgi:hypothetical protein
MIVNGDTALGTEEPADTQIAATFKRIRQKLLWDVECKPQSIPEGGNIESLTAAQGEGMYNGREGMPSPSFPLHLENAIEIFIQCIIYYCHP